MSQVSFEDPFKFMHAFLPRNCICFAFKMFILKTVHTEIYRVGRKKRSELSSHIAVELHCGESSNLDGLMSQHISTSV